ncbi:squamosa promoter-binding-like protein 13A [Argentina anserina]|uniref:squamosa promoter-binding-like protein 13A n=1 Tax=Argentina anserina TaxID=57926 RepID=UPI002176369E|nr:squamosa promoter-binding-like protein 13A [Potentilla anserina]
MDWNLKAPLKAPSSLDLSELEQQAFPSLDTVSGSGSFGDQHKVIKGDFSVDLKLGQLGGSGNNHLADMLKQHGGPKPSSPSPSGASKRSRAAYNASQTVSCLVDGCRSDLSTCRDYHRRHKVCELHSKTPMVTINGQKQRFCQQCSRFHALEEFDEGKRSCRKRLDGHNRRRRKPQPEPLSRSGSFLSNYQGTQLLPFSSSLVYPSTTVVNPTWAGVVKSEADTGLHNQHLQHQNMFLGSSTSSSSYNNGVGNKQQFALFQSSNNNQPHGVSVCQPILNTVSMSDSASSVAAASVKSKMCRDRLTTRIRPDSDCALSLLSSPQTQHQTSDLGLRHMMEQPGLISLMHHHRLGLHGNNINSNNIEPMDSVLVSRGSSDDAHNVHHSSGMFNMGSGESQGNHHHHHHQSSQTLPFHWQ